MQVRSTVLIAMLLLMGVGEKKAAAYDYLKGPEGQVLAWKLVPIVYQIGPLSPDLPEDVQIEAIHRSFETWQNIPQTDVLFEFGGFTDIHHAEDDGTNVVYFQSSGWEEDSKAIATTHSYAFQNGELNAFDLRLNDERYEFTASEDPNDTMTDIQNTVTHEVGHVLGLGHSEDSTATMYKSTGLGDLGKRELGGDDIEGIEALYEPGTLVFRNQRQIGQGCSCTHTPQNGPTSMLSFLLAGSFIHLIRRRRT